MDEGEGKWRTPNGIEAHWIPSALSIRRRKGMVMVVAGEKSTKREPWVRYGVGPSKG